MWFERLARMNGFRTTSWLIIAVVFPSLVISAIAQSKGPGVPWGPGHCPPDENPQFFPQKVFGSNPAFYAECYARYLRSMAVLPLAGSVTQKGAEIYRVLVRPAYSSPVVVRLMIKADGTGELVAKVGKSDTHPEVLAVERAVEVSSAEADTFLRLLNEADFWSMSTIKPLGPVKMMGGTDWMLEGVQEGRHHVVTRGAPIAGPFKDLAVFLVVRLGKIDLRSLPTQPAAR